MSKESGIQFFPSDGKVVYQSMSQGILYTFGPCAPLHSGWLTFMVGEIHKLFRSMIVYYINSCESLFTTLVISRTLPRSHVRRLLHNPVTATSFAAHNILFHALCLRTWSDTLPVGTVFLKRNTAFSPLISTSHLALFHVLFSIFSPPFL
jgi:hypothetical protein